MIRSRLRLTLLMVLAIVIGVAAGAMWLVHSHTLRFESLLEDEHRSIKAANTILLNAALIESHLLDTLDPEAGGAVSIDGPIIAHAARRMRESLELLAARIKSPVEAEEVSELEALTEVALLELRDALDPIARRGAAPAEGLSRVSSAFRGIAEVTQRISALNEARIAAERGRFAGQTSGAILYVGLLTTVAFLVLAVIYWQFSALALRPLATLTESVREIENRNFELSLPVHRDDEIGELSTAYNDMASELRRLYRETDRHIVDLNARNRALLTALPNAVIVLDEDGALLQVNPEAETILTSLGTPDRLPAKLQKLFTRARESGRDLLSVDLDRALLFRIEDREFYYLPRVFRLPPVKDMAPAWGIILSDVTRFRWLDDMKMNVLATASHEIKTPLTSIHMVLNLLLEQKTGTLTALQGQMVQSAATDCDRLLDTLSNLLQLARLTRGSQHLDLKALSPQVLLASTPRSLHQTAEEREVAIAIEANGALPLVLADEPRIAQVLTNLLSNAVRFSPAKSTVKLAARKRGADHVRFSVTDHGPGVPAESQDRLFERFYRAPKQGPQGTGLGLSISREIIEAHNGRIGFTSEPGRPTVFFFDLPLA